MKKWMETKEEFYLLEIVGYETMNYTKEYKLVGLAEQPENDKVFGRFASYDEAKEAMMAL